VATLCRKLEVLPLHAYGVADAAIPDLVAKAAHASSMKGNPIVLTPDELRQIVSASL
jgi:alcohol dehydrogenase class IV